MARPAGGLLFECEAAAKDVALAASCGSSVNGDDSTQIRVLRAIDYPVLTVKVMDWEQRSDDPGRVTEIRTIKRGTVYCVTISIPGKVAPDMMMPYMNGFAVADWMARGLFVAYHRAKQLYLIDRKSSRGQTNDE